MRRKILRIVLMGILLSACICTAILYYDEMKNKIPDTIHIRVGREEILDFSLPVNGMIYAQNDIIETNGGTEKKNGLPVDFDKQNIIIAEEAGSYYMNLKLFGFLPYKSVRLKAVKEEWVIPAGCPIGIYMKVDGVLVIDVGSFIGTDGEQVAPCAGKIQSGDYILEINGEEVDRKKELVQIISECTGTEVKMTIQREGSVQTVSVIPKKDQKGDYKVGIWVKDSAQGIGTMTYVDASGNFGALGHGINDSDTGKILDISEGYLYKTEIVGIKRGEKGVPGELTGAIEYTDNNITGKIDKNTAIGIFGKTNPRLLNLDHTKAMCTAMKQEAHLGDVSILCNIDGKTKKYSASITDINFYSDNINREITIKITDERLLKQTGGIVQGMSGAPIIQDDKLLGAVTHVLVQDASRGYGIFVENMLLMR